ncbi:ATP synthase-associated protein [Plasmodium brasilianum]|uniref:ATP synthase-associated protein n=1 Tax=Plasmodium brasilianum TaxID=5824 RepID=A0ACB9YCS7_PLABR|nr:ATP synthase-associated protein [Plasmodium brasilianum]
MGGYKSLEKKNEKQKEQNEKMIENSLKSTSSDEHPYFLQQNNIYWETGHRTYIPFFHFLIHKYTNKIIDDQIRKFTNRVKSVHHTPFVFHKEGYFRSYYGDPDINMIFNLKKNTNFVFNSTGALNSYNMLSNHCTYDKATQIFDQILMSAFKLDLKGVLENNFGIVLFDMTQFVTT